MKKAIILLCLTILTMPFVVSAQIGRPAPPKISFDFMDADIRNVLRVLADVSKKNIVIAEDVKGKITLKLDNVSHEEALEVVLRSGDLARIEEENIVRVMTAKKLDEERIRASKERSDFRKEQEEKRRTEEDLVNQTIPIFYTDAEHVEKMVKGEMSSIAKDVAETAGKGVSIALQPPKGLLSPRGVVTLVKWNNALIIRDTKKNVDELVRLIREHDIPPQQVQIEARIVQAASSFSKELGVQWGARYNSRVRGQNVELTGSKQIIGDSTATSYMSPAGNLGLRGGGVQFPYNVNLPTIGQPAGTLGIFVGSVADSLQLDLILSALEAQGKAKIISNPKIVTSENRKAIIKQGQQIPYQTSSANQGINIAFKDAVLELDVTPLRVKDGNILLKIKATKDQPDRANPTPTGNIPIDKREADTELVVRDGETVVLGGIYEMNQTTNETGVPLLKHIPLLGWLFKRDTKSDTKTELLIFVTPTILKNLYSEKRDQ